MELTTLLTFAAPAARRRRRALVITDEPSTSKAREAATRVHPGVDAADHWLYCDAERLGATIDARDAHAAARTAYKLKRNLRARATGSIFCPRAL